MDWPGLREFQAWANNLEQELLFSEQPFIAQLMCPWEQSPMASNTDEYYSKMRDLIKNVRLTISEYYHPANRGEDGKGCRLVIATGGSLDATGDGGWCHFHGRDGSQEEECVSYGDPHASTITKKNKLSAHIRIGSGGLFEISARFNGGCR
jgi:hypothetical protein